MLAAMQLPRQSADPLALGFVTHVGAATVALAIGGVQIVTDPALDPAGTTYTMPVAGGRSLTMRRTVGSAIAAAEVPAADVVLLTHDHPDHLDHAGRAFAETAPLVLTTRAAASALSANAAGLAPWETYEIDRGGTCLRITATPARHGPPEAAKAAGDVVGFIVQVAGADGAVYISGDTVCYDGLDEIGRRYHIDTAFLFFGDAHFPETGGMAFTMNGREGARLAAMLGARTVIPVHYDAFSHLAEPPAAIARAFGEAGLANRLRWLPQGIPQPLP
jgi:L-ascorbate metabolism protein UlaG (beta-lactamase superfamily)